MRRECIPKTGFVGPLRAPQDDSRRSPLPVRHGFSVVELMVGCVLTVALVTTIGPLSVQSRRMTQETRVRSLALDYLSDRLEEVTMLPASRLDEALAALSVEPAVAAALGPCRLIAKRFDDDGMIRVQLTIESTSGAFGRPVLLEGWVRSSLESTDEERTEGDNAP